MDNKFEIEYGNSDLSDDNIANACMKCVDDWDMDTLLQFAYDEMFHHYTEVASPESLESFMKEMEPAPLNYPERGRKLRVPMAYKEIK